MEATFEEDEAIPTPAPTIPPTPVPTPTATPSPTPTPIPTATPTPQPGVVKINVPAPTATPEARQETSFSAPYGTMRFTTTPANATVYINGEPLKQRTPISRDFEPAGYNISIVLDGYESFEKTVILRNLDDIPIDVKLQPVEPEVTPVVMSVASIPEVNGSIAGTTKNESNATVASQPNEGESSIFWLVFGVIALVAIGVLAGCLLIRKTASRQTVASGEDDIGEVVDSPNTVEEQKRKILSIIKNNPVDTTDEEILEKLQEIYNLKISGRTLTRRKAELKTEGKI